MRDRGFEVVEDRVQEHPSRSGEQHTRVYYYGCGPGGTFGWGVGLLVVGGLWLLAALEVVASDLIWPLALIGLGAFHLFWGRRRGDREAW